MRNRRARRKGVKSRGARTNCVRNRRARRKGVMNRGASNDAVRNKRKRSVGVNTRARNKVMKSKSGSSVHGCKEQQSKKQVSK